MADNNFFRNFLKKDKFFHATQNNPVHKKTYHQTPYVINARIHFTDNANARIGNAAYDQNVRFHPAPAMGMDDGIQRVRLPVMRASRNIPFETSRQLSTSYSVKRTTMEEFGEKPARNVLNILPNVDIGMNLADRIKENQAALASIGRFEVGTLTHLKPDDKNTNYWYPDYQGTMHFTSKNTIQAPTPPISDDFVPKGYLSNKQKESYVWLKMDWT